MEVDFPSSSSSDHHGGSSSSSFYTQDDDDDGGFMGWDGKRDNNDKERKPHRSKQRYKNDDDSRRGSKIRRRRSSPSSSYISYEDDNNDKLRAVVAAAAGGEEGKLIQQVVVKTKTNDGNSRQQQKQQHRRSTIDDAMEYQQEIMKRRDSYNSTFSSGTELSVDFPIAPRRLSSNCSSVTLELATGHTTTTKATAGTNVNSSEIDTCRQLIEQEKQRWESLHNSQSQNQQQYQKQQSSTSKHSSPAISRRSTPTHPTNNPINPPYKRRISLTQSLDDTVNALPILGWDHTDMDSSLASSSSSSSSSTTSCCTQEATARRNSFMSTFIMEEKKGEEEALSPTPSMIMSYDPRASFKPASIVPYNKREAVVVITNQESEGGNDKYIVDKSSGGKSIDKSIMINKNNDCAVRRSKNNPSTIPTSIENTKKEITTTTTQQQQSAVTIPQLLISSWSSLRQSGGHTSSTSMSTSLLLEGIGEDANNTTTAAYNDSMTDLYQVTTKNGGGGGGGGGDLCEEFVERQQLRQSQLYDNDSKKIPKYQKNSSKMKQLSLQPQDEINPNKPWLTIPTTTTTTNTNGEKYTLGGLGDVYGNNTTTNNNNRANKRGSGLTSRSSIESSLTESFLLATILLQPKFDTTTDTIHNDNGTMIDTTCRIDNDDNDVAIAATDRGEEMSVLSEEGSELTELRQAQEALLNGRRDSVVSNSSSNKHQMKNISELDVIVQEEEEEIEVRHHPSFENVPFIEVNDLDNEEIDPRRQQRRNTKNPISSFSSSSSSSSSNNPFSGDSDEESNAERRYDVDYRLESVKPIPENSRRDLLSYARNDLSSHRASDDSVSYSDIDPEVPPPSIKMCMTVRDTMIEREFDTVQLADIDYGEKKMKKKSTLEDLFEGDDDLDASYTSSQCERSHPSKNSSSKTVKFATNLSDKKRVLMDGMVKTAAITTKLGHTRSAKNIRRKNKRRWKYCVWNCRKITLVVVLSLTLIIGVGILSRWGYSKQLTSSNTVETESENDSVAIMEGTPTLEGGPVLAPTMFPSLPDGGGLESMGTDSQAPLNATSNSSYPTPSLISSNTSSSFPTFSGIHNNHTYNSSQSLHPNATILSNSSSIMNISSQSSLSPSSSLSTLTNATHIYNSSLYPSTSPSSNTTLFNRSDIYESIQIIKGSNAFEHTGASVSMSPNGEFIAVGYKEADGVAVKKTGLVRVYQRNSMNTSYTSLGRDSMYGKATDDEFGASVSISNDGHRVAVGARSSSSMDKVKNGEVMVFEYNNVSQSWLQLGNSIQGMQDAARLGFSVSLSGDGFRLAVGAPKDNGHGSVGVYDYNYEGKEWILLDDFIFGEADGDRTGFSVSLSNDGSTVAVGSAFTSSSTGDLSNSGSTAVYKIEGGYASSSSVSLIKQGKTLVGANEDAQFGFSVSLSSNGTRLAVGSNGFRSKNLTRAGRCAVYELQQENWIEIGHFIGTEENEETGLHVAIALNGNVVSCSKQISIGATNIGSVAILEEVKAGWNVLDFITASLGKSSSFGESVSLSHDGKWIVAGDPSYYSSRGFVDILTRLD